jgi:hypothetical protein
MIKIPVGSKEFLVVDVEDRFDTISNLTGSNPTYDVRLQDDDDNWVLQTQAAVIGPGNMQLECLVDTDGWDLGNYELFTEFINLPEQPRLGPMVFEVV